MKTFIQKTFFRFILFCNIACIIFILISNLAPFLDPVKYWPVALLGMLFPVLLMAALVFMAFWLFLKKRKSLISLFAILISLPHVFNTYAINFPTAYEKTKVSGNLRIVTWNVGLMNYTAEDTITAIENNSVIFNKLHETNADIICLQEFFTCIIPCNYYNLLDSFAKSMEYPYHYFSLDIPKFKGKFFIGNIIFSRDKIIDTLKIGYPKPFPGSIIKTGILVNHDTIDIFTTRLQPVGFQKNEYQELNNIKNGTDSGFSGSKNIIAKIQKAYMNRLIQINIVKKLVGESKRPVILTGDLNDVPVSYTYNGLKMDMSDTWEKKGTGLGRTFKFISPTLRIDYIFYNKFFGATQVDRIITDDASDHDGLVADLYFLNKKQ